MPVLNIAEEPSFKSYPDRFLNPFDDNNYHFTDMKYKRYSRLIILLSQIKNLYEHLNCWQAYRNPDTCR